MAGLFEKYRPATLDEIVGQDAAVRQVRTILARGWGGRAWWLTGASGTGKTTLARIIAAHGADELAIDEIDAQTLTPARLRDVEDGMRYRMLGSKPGKAVIVNEAHGLRKDAIRQLLVVLERLPGHACWLFTTTKAGGLIDASQELEKLLMAMLAITLAQDFAGRDVQSSEQGGGAVADVIVRVPFGLTGAKRQQGLRPVESLNLRLLVDAQNDGALGRIEIQADDVADLVDEERIGGQLERLGKMRLESEGFPDADDGRLRKAEGLGHGTRAPVGGVFGFGFQGASDDFLDLGIGDRSRGAGPGFVDESIESVVDEALSPFADSSHGDLEVRSHLGIGATVGTGQDDPGPKREALSGSGTICPVDERGSFVVRENQQRLGSTDRHD